jgi:hypothetical protein
MEGEIDAECKFVHSDKHSPRPKIDDVFLLFEEMTF